MRVFVTGATGFIGSAIVKELISAGHQVVGLARSDEAEQALVSVGAEFHRGSLENLDSLKRGAEASDGVIHAGFINDFSNLAAACKKDCRAIEAMVEVLKGTNRPFVSTSVITVLKPGNLGKELDRPYIGSAGTERIASEEVVHAMAKYGVRSSVVRLAPCVHDESRQGFATRLASIAKNKGISAYVGEGLNRWPAVHRLDVAKLYRLALESAPAGSYFHGVTEEGILFREIAEAIGKRHNLPSASISQDEVGKHFEWLAQFALSDNPVSNEATKKILGWTPTRPTLVQDILNSL